MDYQSGTCNIDGGEARKRYAMGGLGFLAAAVLIALIHLNTLSPSLMPVVFFPLYAGFLGVLQGYLNFCAGFGMKGMQSTGSEPVNVSSEEDADRDRRRSLKILVAAGILSGAVTLVAVFA